MGSINLNYKQSLEKYKGKIIGFDKNGFAVYPSNGFGCQALDTCEVCGQVIHSQLCGANFCPVCAVQLDIVSEEVARELCVPEYIPQFDALHNDPDYARYNAGLICGFQRGIQFALENAYASLKDRVSFKIW
jgi:hypothetical protein